MSLFHLDCDKFETLRAVVEAAIQDGYERLEYNTVAIGGAKNYDVKLSILSRLLKEEKFHGIKIGGWMYSYASGSVRNGGKIFLLLTPFPLPIIELNKLQRSQA